MTWKQKQLIVLKLIVDQLDNQALRELEGKLKENLVCIIGEKKPIELWVTTSQQQLHTLTYQIVTAIKKPVEIYIAQLDGTTQPLLIHGTYNRNITIRQAKPLIIQANETIELECYKKLSQCMKTIFQLQRKQVIRLKTITKTNNTYTIQVQVLKQLNTLTLIQECIRVTKPKRMPP